MMREFKGFSFTFAFILGMQIATSDGAAFAHGIVTPLPTSHALATANALKALLLHRKVATPTVVGTGSATVRLNNQIIKSLITKGYASGQNQAISSQLGGAVNSGNLTGALYFASGGSYVNNTGYFSFTIGGAPAAALGPVSAAFNNSNTLSFAASSILKQHNIGIILPYSGGVSGAERARTALYKSVTSAATAAGQKSIVTLGPISGGELYGTFGQYYGNNLYLPSALGAIAFGNNPFSSSAIPALPTSQLRNFLTFANGTSRTITGGQLTFNLNTQTGPNNLFNFGTYGLAFGNSAYNNSILLKTYQYSLLKNAINLQALKLR